MDRKLILWSGGVLLVLAIGAWIYVRRLPQIEHPIEVPIQIIPLSNGAELPSAELSGLAWFEDQLVLLPQYPARDGRCLYAIERENIAQFLAHPRASAPVTVRQVPLETGGLEEAVVGFDGFEALVFVDRHVYLSVEIQEDTDDAVSAIVMGEVIGDLDSIRLDPTRRAPLPAQTDLENTGYETLVAHGDRLVAIYETNGAVNHAPRAMSVDLELRTVHPITFAPLEYRATDATDVDRNGRFWVTNYHWPGAPWSAGACAITERHGQGASHARCATVERLVELRFTDRGVAPTETPPIQLQLIDDEHARNWEGLVRFGSAGFLAATDEHPTSILAFIPAAPDSAEMR